MGTSNQVLDNNSIKKLRYISCKIKENFIPSATWKICIGTRFTSFMDLFPRLKPACTERKQLLIGLNIVLIIVTFVLFCFVVTLLLYTASFSPPSVIKRVLPVHEKINK